MAIGSDSLKSTHNCGSDPNLGFNAVFCTFSE